MKNAAEAKQRFSSVYPVLAGLAQVQKEAYRDPNADSSGTTIKEVSQGSGSPGIDNSTYEIYVGIIQSQTVFSYTHLQSPPQYFPSYID